MRCLDGHDLALEAPLLGRRGRACVRRHRELVQLGPRDLPLLGDELRAQALRDELEAVEQLLRPGCAEELGDLHGRVERNVVHVLDARRDDELVAARGDERRGVADRRLRRAAAPVDGDGRHLDRVAGLQPRVARDVA